ncbi:iron-containing redox enzyme family protein [Pseudomonas sp. S75]|uniref:iron-containing redox enzyme family protein n=1 Tax=unclassified Pseudomonas TaxID=196821 RepID=UPI00190642EC|nr:MULTISPECIES: iron-containing redox enzyme family protein [unclassified Pseudomonas]MBJ9977636.1 iron-containing redox enzyme family protein [Pseudomonas sp. S30]MBK0155008.1 iron-containing redox enzyme family protein [Pseudomonas sp. S75]
MKRFDRHAFEPDLTTSIPAQALHFSIQARQRLQDSLGQTPQALYEALLADIESEDSQLLALAVLHGTFEHCQVEPLPERIPAQQLIHWIEARREGLADTLAQLCGPDALTDAAVLKARAPISLVAGCWLDRVSQPATEPAMLVSRLTAHRFALKGKGVVGAGQQACRVRALAERGVHLPALYSARFMEACDAPTTVVQCAAFYLALSRWPASYLPEVLGVHYAHYRLAVDDRLLGGPSFLPATLLDRLLESVYETTARTVDGAADLQRFLRGVALGAALEQRSLAAMVSDVQARAALSLTQRVGRIVKRHMPYAGRQHAYVRLGDRRLPDWFGTYTDEEIAAFMAAFSRSRSIKRNARGSCPFLEATKFGGSMFGLFTQDEFDVLAAWTQEVQDGHDSETVEQASAPGTHPEDAVWTLQPLSLPVTIRWQAPQVPSDRELLHRLVNIEAYANTLELIRSKIEDNLRHAERLFDHGQAGRFTDASWLPWDRQALAQRAQAIYWNKLVEPWQRLETVPDRETVIFGQKLAALGSLLDGCWAHRVASVARYNSRTDAMLYAIYADEMGNGELEKNHIVLIQRVLRSLGIELPHIRDEAFIDQAELPDLYAFALHQLGLSLFPDSFYPEILGYNLGIEMLGLGEMRLHEIQKLRRHGFDTVYEEAHLTIDNFSNGHARQSLLLIEHFMDDTARHASADELACVWRRVWRGYASFAWFIETDLQNAVMANSRPAMAELIL